MNAGSSPSDDLLARLARADEAALAEVCTRHGRMVYNACLRQLGDPGAAEDAAQTAFLVLWRKAAALSPATDLGGWLHQAAVLAARETRRAARRRAARERRAAEMRESQMAGPPADWLALRGELDEELARLPERERSVVVLGYLEGLSRTEVAARLHLPEGTVATLNQRALERLRRRYGKRGVLLSAAALAALLTGHAAEAAEPASLLPAVLSAAKGATAAAVAASTVPASAALALTEEVLKTMFYARLKWAATVLFAATVALSFTGAVWLTVNAQEPPPVAAPPTNRPVVRPAVEDKRVDPARLAQAEVVIRAQVWTPPPGQPPAIGGLGPFNTRFSRLVVQEVIKDGVPAGLKPGDEISLAHDQREPLPPGVFTAYLKTEALKVPPGVRFNFVGAVAAGARYAGAKEGTSHTEGAAGAAVGEKKFDPARLAQAEVVIRARVPSRGRGGHGIDGLYLRLEVLEVLKDERTDKLKAGDLIPFACDFDHRGGPVPNREFTAYLRTEAQKLPEPPGFRYVFIGTPAAGARFAGAKEGVSHAEPVIAPGKAIVSGTVVDAAGRGPVAGAKVTVYPADPKLHGPKVTRKVTNPDGSVSTVTGPVFPEGVTSEVGTFEVEVPPCDDLIVQVQTRFGSGSKTGVKAKANEWTDVGAINLHTPKKQ